MGLQLQRLVQKSCAMGNVVVCVHSTLRAPRQEQELERNSKGITKQEKKLAGYDVPHVVVLMVNFAMNVVQFSRLC